MSPTSGERSTRPALSGSCSRVSSVLLALCAAPAVALGANLRGDGEFLEADHLFRFDANGNSLLDLTEALRYVQVRGGKQETEERLPGSVTSGCTEDFSRADENQDGELDEDEVLWFWRYTETRHLQETKQGVLQGMFSAADHNGDGVVDLTELIHSFRAKTEFFTFHNLLSGQETTLSLDRVKKHRTWSSDPKPVALQSGLPMFTAAVWSTIYDKQLRFCDLDSSGALSEHEYFLFAKPLEGSGTIEIALDMTMRPLDEDKSGGLSWDEYVKAFGAGHDNAAGSPNRPFRSLDMDNDGQISASEFLVVLYPNHKRGRRDCKEVLADMDTDKDGKITWPEFTATEVVIDGHGLETASLKHWKHFQKLFPGHRVESTAPLREDL